MVLFFDREKEVVNMGVLKYKWILEEEEVFMVGVFEYGIGKWCLIFGNFEYFFVLYFCLNVDFKVSN